VNRYIVIQALSEYLGSRTQTPDVGNWLVVDHTPGIVIADCGDMQSRADKVALALNALDGGPL
jgi:hypothetical protein